MADMANFWALLTGALVVVRLWQLVAHLVGKS
jgi:hypothetical protein